MNDKGRSLIRMLGFFLILGGLGLASYYFLAFDVSAVADGGELFGPTRVANLSKMSEREAAISYGSLLALLGVAMMYAGREVES